MPRLTNPNYLERYRFCAAAWKDFRVVFSVVPANQQFDIHRYYQTARRTPEADLLKTREELTKAAPSLPQRASKAFAQVYQVFQIAFEQSQGDEVKFFAAVETFASARRSHMAHVYSTSAGRVLRVRGLVRAEPDLHKLAQALLALAEQAPREQQAGKDDSQSEAA